MPAGVPVSGAARERFAFVHGLRGIASLLVVWSHLSGFWLLENGRTSALQDLWYQFVARPFHLYQNGGHLGVVLFFLISGYIITHASLGETRRSFAVRRVMRIFPPLAAALLVSWLLLQLALATGTELLGVNGGPWWHWLSAVFLVDGLLPGGRALDVTWTLVIEMLFYALTFVVLTLSRRRPMVATVIMIGAWAAACIAMINWGSLAGQNGALVLYVGFLLVGRLLYLWDKRGYAGVDVGVGVVVVLGMYGVFVETMEPGFLLTPGGWSGVEPLVSYGIALAVFFVCMRWAPGRVIRPLSFLGDISYSLYLLHIPVGITVLNLLALVGVPESFASLAAIAASILAAWVGYRLVERPSQALARRFSGPRLSTQS